MTIWCVKKIEVHQYRNGNETIDEFDFDNKKDSYSIAIFNDSNNNLVALEKGDYSIYNPNKDLANANCYSNAIMVLF